MEGGLVPVSSEASRLGGAPRAMTAGRVVIPMRGLGVGVARVVDSGGVGDTGVDDAGVGVEASAVGPWAIALGAAPCPWRSSTLPRGAAAGSTTSTASAAAAPIRT